MAEPVPLWVLIHSPLVGPYTWAPVADDLRRRGCEVVVPALREDETTGAPYWRQHVAAVTRALAMVPPSGPLILVGHSGGGMLLPAIREAAAQPVVAYLFVDAAIPADGRSRLDHFGDRGEVAAFRAAAVGGQIAPWSDADLREAIPDAPTRARFVGGLRPLPLAVYEEPLPVFAGWPDAPVGYLQFSSVYDAPAAEARRGAWPVRRLPGGHFHLLVAPDVVAAALLELVAHMGVAAPGAARVRG